MKDKKLITLLHIIAGSGNVKRLLREGMTFKDVTLLTNIAIEKGFLTYENEKVALTNSGVEFLKLEQDILKKQNKEEWIEKDLKNKIPKLEKNTIFLPRQNELTF